MSIIFIYCRARRIQETGIRSREMRLLFAEKPKCMSKKINFISVDIRDCYFANAILAGGLVLSFVVLLLEIYWKRINNKIKETQHIPHCR